MWRPAFLLPAQGEKYVKEPLFVLPLHAGNGWWWVLVVAPIVGATLGTATYQLLVALHPAEDSEPFPKVTAAQLKASDLGTVAH